MFGGEAEFVELLGAELADGLAGFDGLLGDGGGAVVANERCEGGDHGKGQLDE